MDETLQQLADTVKDHEYEDLFPDTEVEQAKNNEEKVKTALFQVHYMVWNPELYEKVHSDTEDYYISIPEIRETCETSKEFERIEKGLRGATVQENDEGHTLVPKTDLRDVLSPRKGLMD